MSATEIIVPDKVKRLPLFQGMHIGFMFHVDQHGIPDFKILDAGRRLMCLTAGLCGICGQQLSLAKCFFLGPKSVVHGVSFDPAMHHDCAKYSRAVCPYLAGQHGHVPLDKMKVTPGWTIAKDSLTDDVKPASMFLVRTLSYEIVEHEGQVYAKSGPYISKEEFALQHRGQHA